MKLLHITNWYPNHQNPKEALWIKNHIDSLNKGYENKVLHIEVRKSSSWYLHQGDYSNYESFTILYSPVNKWVLIEILTSFLLIYSLFFRINVTGYNIINFHIAYPLLTYWHLLKRIVRKPIVITEHWSAYHFRFGVKNNKKLKRIKRIFSHKIPVIAVSKSLLNDIRLFSEENGFNGYIIPNVVDTSIFRHLSSLQIKKNLFFMLSYWKWPKNPFTVLKSFAEIYNEGNRNWELKIGGYGPQYAEMKEMVRALDLQSNVTFLGTMCAKEIIAEVNEASAFLHCSEYETFSVVCAEALCCGCPILISESVAISEYVDESNGVIVSKESDWTYEIKKIIDSVHNFNRAYIAEKASQEFAAEKICKKYMACLRSVMDGTN